MNNAQTGGQTQQSTTQNVMTDVVLPVIFTVITFVCLVQLVMMGLEQAAVKETVTAISAFAS